MYVYVCVCVYVCMYVCKTVIPNLGYESGHTGVHDKIEQWRKRLIRQQCKTRYR